MLIRHGLKHSLVGKTQERIIFHLDLDAFFAQVEEAADPRLRGRPVFVVGHSMTSGVVLTSNYEARKYGVKTGMALHEAKRLCPGALLVPADHEKYTDTSEQIFSYLQTHTPQVEIFSIDEAFMDVTVLAGSPLSATPRGYRGNELKCGVAESGLPAEPEVLAREIKTWVWNNFHLTISVGIAPNKLLAKLASGLKKPDGLVRVRTDEIDALLKNLPIEELCGIGARLKFHLNQMGIFTAGDLGRFSETVLFERFGVIGFVLKRMGEGKDHSPVLRADHIDPIKSIGHSYTLPRALQDRRQVFRYLLWLSEKVARRLRRVCLEGQTIHAVLRFSDFETVAKQKNFPFFINDGKVIFEQAKELFNRLDRAGKAVRLLGVSVSGLRPAGQEEWLFEDFKRRTRLLQAIDNINDKYGEFTLRPAFLTFPDDEKIASRALQLFGSGR